jgi:hypothetical protein
MNLQHVQVKVFAGPESMPDLGGAIPVFHRWIQQRAFDELLIDVADYRHVPYGPGVVLVGHEAFRSLDQAHPGLGLLYSRRASLEGSSRQKLQQAFEAALATCAQLESEPEFSGKLAFDLRNLQVSVNDRLLAPNTDESWAVIEPELRAVFAEYRIERTGNGGSLLTALLRK